jgi:hypothetical protein
MAARGLPAGTARGLSSAVRRFPEAEFVIRRLVSRSETFRDICEELADAEFALSKVPATPPELCEARKLEWQEMVDRLIGEVAIALRESEAWKTTQAGVGEHIKDGG